MSLALIALSGDVELNPGYRCLADVRKAKGLKIAHFNLRSLRNKADMLRIKGLDSKTVDVLTLSKTWLDLSFDDSEIALPGFACIQLDRLGNKEYGGVAIYVQERLPFRVRQDLNSADQEWL